METEEEEVVVEGIINLWTVTNTGQIMKIKE